MFLIINMQLQEISYIRPKSLTQLVTIQLGTHFLLHQNVAWELKIDSWIKLWFSSYQQVVFPCWLEFYAWLFGWILLLFKRAGFYFDFPCGWFSWNCLYAPPPRAIVSAKQCCCHAQTVLCYLSINLKFEMEMLCNDWYFWAPCLRHDLEMNQFVLCC